MHYVRTFVLSHPVGRAEQIERPRKSKYLDISILAKKVCVHAFGCFFRYFRLIFDRHVVYALKVRPILCSMIGESCTSDWCEGYGLFLNDLPPQGKIHKMDVCTLLFAFSIF